MLVAGRFSKCPTKSGGLEVGTASWPGMGLARGPFWGFAPDGEDC